MQLPLPLPAYHPNRPTPCNAVITQLWLCCADDPTSFLSGLSSTLRFLPCHQVTLTPTCGREVAVVKLLRHGAKVEWTTLEKKQTALHFATRHGMKKVTEQLCKENVDVNAMDAKVGVRCMMHALAYSHVLRLLIRLGTCNRNACDRLCSSRRRCLH